MKDMNFEKELNRVREILMTKLNASDREALRRVATHFGFPEETMKPKMAKQKRKVSDDDDDDHDYVPPDLAAYCSFNFSKKKRTSTYSISLSKPERLMMREKPIMIHDQIESTPSPLPLPVLKQGSLEKKESSFFYATTSYNSHLPFKKRRISNGVIMFSDPVTVLDHEAQKTPPDIPIDIKNKITAMGGTDLKLVIEKQLYESDCDTGEGRLSMPISQIRASDFLTDVEKALLETMQVNGRNKSGIKVKFYDPKGKEWSPSLKKWDMVKKGTGQNNPMYVLVSGWNKIVKDNKFKPNTPIQLWSFRERSELCLVLVKVGRRRNNNGGGNDVEGESSVNGGGASTSQTRDTP